MARTRRSRNGALNNNNHPRKRSTARPAQVELSTADLKHLAKAPGDYQDIARKFADALEATKFRGSVSPQKLRTMVARGQRLAQRKAMAADRRRMLQDSQAWKSMLSNWRLVVAAMPDRPELETMHSVGCAVKSVEFNCVEIPRTTKRQQRPTPDPCPDKAIYVFSLGSLVPQGSPSVSPGPCSRKNTKDHPSRDPM